MENKTGRPKKYQNTKRIAIVINIINPWKDVADKLEELSISDNSEDFKNYCNNVEGANLSTKGPNRLSTYCRWVLSKHVTKKLSNQEVSR